CALEVEPKGLFNNQAGVLFSIGYAGTAQRLGDICDEAGGYRQIKKPMHFLFRFLIKLFYGLSYFFARILLGKVSLLVFNMILKFLPAIVVCFAAARKFIDTFQQMLSKFFATHLFNIQANYKKVFGEPVIQVKVIKGRNQLAPG